jgi:hypothetical protein
VLDRDGHVAGDLPGPNVEEPAGANHRPLRGEARTRQQCGDDECGQ